MKFSDEMLMAYADGELDLVARAEIEDAMARDPALAMAVERHRALAARVRSAYDGVLEERVPERLAGLVAGARSPAVTDLATRRAGESAAIRRWQLPSWAAVAASLAVGLFVGMLLMRGPGAPFEETGGGLVARGELADALASQLASAPVHDGVRIGVSFRDRGGDYCRTFQLKRAAGLACHRGDDWQLDVLAAAAPEGGGLRPAAAMPLPVLQAVDAAIDGEPLDADAERLAHDGGW